MTRYLTAVENVDPPENKQARELLQYFVSKVGYGKKADLKKWNEHLATQTGRNTALKDSRANPKLTFNYYRPGLLFYGHMKLWEDNQEIAQKQPETDPFNRKRKAAPAKSTKARLDELRKLVENGMDEIEKLEKQLEDENNAAEASGIGGRSGDDDLGIVEEFGAEPEGDEGNEGIAESEDDGTGDETSGEPVTEWQDEGKGETSIENQS